MKYTKNNSKKRYRMMISAAFLFFFPMTHEHFFLRRTQKKRIRPCDSFTSRVTGADPYRPITSHLSILPIPHRASNIESQVLPVGYQHSSRRRQTTYRQRALNDALYTMTQLKSLTKSIFCATSIIPPMSFFYL